MPTEIFANVPGVIIREVQLGAPPIVGVNTSRAGFVGEAPKPAAFKDQPKFITSLDEFEAHYVDPTGKSNEFSLAVRGFFQNGGTSCYIVNCAKNDAPAAIVKLGLLEDVQILAAPGNSDVHTELMDQAAKKGDRFAILDPLASATPANVAAPGATSDVGGYAAFYFPRILVKPPLPSERGSDPVAIAPSGHIAGVYARTDANRGVHKAPANEGLRGVSGLTHLVTDSQQDPLNLTGVNIIRLFGAPVIWGARTLAGPTNDYAYISTRRLVTYIEQSLKTSLRFAVFEPNNLTLQKIIARSVRGFLDGVWRDGALFGATADEAYYVRFPPNFNTDAERRQGKLVIEIGLRITYPAEFITIRIGLLSEAANAA